MSKPKHPTKPIRVSIKFHDQMQKLADENDLYIGQLVEILAKGGLVYSNWLKQAKARRK